jgi:hypothetical protein
MAEMEMRRVSIAALVVAILSAGVSGFALWRTYDTESASPTTVGGAGLPGGATSSSVGGLVVIPSQAGKHGLQAVADLEAVGLKVKISYKPSVTVPMERVVNQVPLEGKRVPAGTVVEIFLSSGPP